MLKKWDIVTGSLECSVALLQEIQERGATKAKQVWIEPAFRIEYPEKLIKWVAPSSRASVQRVTELREKGEGKLGEVDVWVVWRRLFARL